MRAESQDVRMGQSLPIPTDLPHGTRTGSPRTGAVLVRVGPPPDGRIEAIADDAPDPAPVVPPEATSDAFSAAIVRGKVRPPVIRPTTLERPRLLGWLERHAQQRVRVIVAEAGYGKSTLIADHVKRTGRRVAWYRLEATDADWVGMLSYVVASIREVIPDFAVGAVNLLQRVGVLNATRDMVLDTILAELETHVIEPLTLILDDFHAVQQGEDVRAIVSRLIELAPEPLNFIIAGRRHPTSLLARASSLGQVVELGTSDLRFTKSETAHLLTSILGYALDDDLVAIIDERVAGWCASLQLIGTSLIGLRPGSVRVSIEELTSRSEPLYDFLGEQVLGRQPAAIRRVLSVASILERIEPTLVLAAMTGDPHASPRRVDATLAHAEDAGIVSRTSSNGRWLRFHPLVRDFMLSRLLENTGRPALLEMHLRVARTAEPLDWATSAHHYIEAEHQGDAMRVLRESAIEALGTASWGAATALADRMPDQPVPEAVSVIRALDMASRGLTRRAANLLESLDPSRDDAMAWGLTKAALANVYLVLGDIGSVRDLVEAMGQLEDLPPVVASLAHGFDVLVLTHEGGRLADASEELEQLARDHVRLGLAHYAGVSFHNAALAAFARGRYDSTVELAKRAIEQFDRTPSRHGVQSTQTLVAQALCELGQPDRAGLFIDSVSTDTKTPADAQADAAWMAAATGDTDTAWVFIEQAARTALDASTVPSAAAYAQYSKVLAHLVDGDAIAARKALHGALENSVELDAVVKHIAVSSLVALLSGELPDALSQAREGLVLADRQGALHWTRWLQLIAAVADANAAGFRRSLVSLAASAKLSTLVLADAVVLGLGLIGEVPADVLELIRAWPARWLPALRRVVQSQDRAAGMVAAELLSTMGTIEDVAILSAFERRHIRQPVRRTLSRRLARHANPTMVVHDLGRIRLQLGQRVIPLSQSRRKAASLVAYLASRPSHSAARDQVLDAIWPNQSPEGAANSLHQTLYFLRRDIDPCFEDGHSVDYMVVEPDVVYLDPDLVQVDSAAFFRQVSAAIASDNVAELAMPLLRDYQAKFALDFEYEEWSLAWRDQLHGLFLDMAQATANALVTNGRHHLAAEVLERVLAIDPYVLDLEATLVIALHRAGATAAAVHQYRHYAKAHEEELGVVAPTLAVLLGAAEQI